MPSSSRLVLGSSLALIGFAGGAFAQTLPAGFCWRSIEVHPTQNLTGIAPSPGGAFGDGVFVSMGGEVRRVVLETGAVSTFASGLAFGTSRPSGAAFDTGIFGTGALYVVQNNQNVGVLEVQPDGSWTVFSAGNTLFSCNDIALASPASPFGPFAFVTNGSFNLASSISKVDAAGTNSTFVDQTGFCQGSSACTSLGLAFPPRGSAFGDDLYVTDFSRVDLFRVDSNGTVTSFAQPGTRTVDIAFSTPGSPFGEFMYVSHFDAQLVRKILRIDPAGVVTEFASGFAFAADGWTGDVAFSLDGESLLLADQRNLVCITFGPKIATYCTAKQNSCGSGPAITASGVPSASATSGFTLRVANAKAGKIGVFLYSDSGPAGIPFQGGFLCIDPTGLRRTVAVQDTTGAAPNCDGELALDMNCFASGQCGGNPAAFLSTPGQQVNCQVWARDTVANGSLLSNGLAYAPCP